MCLYSCEYKAINNKKLLVQEKYRSLSNCHAYKKKIVNKLIFIKLLN